MADIREPDAVKLIVGMLSAFPGAFAAAEEALTESFGPIDQRSDVTAHEFTDYYRDEKGHSLMRCFVSCELLVDPGELANVKRYTNDLERQIAASGEFSTIRPINLDPGYVTPAKLVLASCKDYTHRIYLGGGIYAETTLGYTHGRWEPYAWTYPDYRTAGYQAFLSQVREALMARRQGSLRG